MSAFRDLFPQPKPIIGVIHLPALPGYPESPGIDRVIEKALGDLSAFEQGGVDGVLVENFSDRPFRAQANPETIAAMTRVTLELVVASKKSVVGVEILLNDPKTSLGIAHATGAAFMRTDFFVDPMERPEFVGQMKIDPEGLMAYRKSIGADDVLILAEIQVKFARMMVERSLIESARLAAEHHADAIGVTGTATGDPSAVITVEEAKRGAGDCPILVGSGLRRENAKELLSAADGALVGASLKTGARVDARKVAALVEVVRALDRA